MMISITLPSLHPQSLERALDNISATTSNRSETEVLVISPFRPEGAWGVSVIWIREGDPEGANAAHAIALKFAMGDFVLAWVDDHELVPGWDEIALADFREREGAFRQRHPEPFKPYGSFCLGLRQIEPAHIGTVFGNYYPYFPFMRRADAAPGFWLTGEYRVGFADCDLGMRIWNAGGRCEWSKEPLVRVLPDDERKKAGADWTGEAHTSAADQALFLSRWANRFGAGYDTSGLRGFNVDVPLDTLPLGARTIWKGEAQ